YECRLRYRGVQRLLNAVDYPAPERPAAYEEDLWNKLLPKLPVRSAQRWRLWRPWLAAGAAALLVLLAFLAGRYSPRQEREQAVAAPSLVRERVLAMAVGDHLERSQVVLVELA